MRVTTMRRVDRLVGIPACGILTLARWVLEGLCRRRRQPDGPPRRILFVKLAEQGATVLAAGAIREAAELVGREGVYLLAFAENRPVLEAMALIPPENMIPLETTGPAALLASTIRALWQVRRLGIDTAIDLEFFARASAALTFLSGARRRVGLHAFKGEAPYRGDLMTHRLLYNHHLHASQIFTAMVRALRVPPERFPAFASPTPPLEAPLPRFVPTPEEREEVRAMLPEGIGGPKALVLLNSNTSDLVPMRRWPAERYVELGRRLLARYPELYVAFTGSPAEAPEAERLAAAVGSDRCLCLAGKTTLRGLLTLFTLAEVLVTNDSGPAHFASLTPIDAVTLFGPEPVSLFGALGPRSHLVRAEIPCSPCVTACNGRVPVCSNNLCMQSIGVERVFDEVCRVYERRRAGRPDPSIASPRDPAEGSATPADGGGEKAERSSPPGPGEG